MLSAIQVRRHWISKLALTAHDEPTKNATSTIKIETLLMQGEKSWKLSLTVRLGVKGDGVVRPAYTGMVAFEGEFEIHPDFPAEKTEDLVKMNGGAILYAAARELILTLTSRSAHGPFEIPTIDARMFLQESDPIAGPQKKENSKGG